ncbi:MAG TPA: DUF484 family protein [Steroidobacteraceae bacterium]|jgi:Uncharacterized protein conserved in bacteria|nr:DUF484 family protein [Steroidobacteraceae bacterium]
MSKQPVGRVDEETLDESMIADYLQGNPDFFERHATLLTKLKLPHNRGSSAISLVERQVAALRDKNEKLETRLRELIEVARGNDVLAAKIHRLACRLVRAADAGAVMESLEASLREDFGASEWILLLPAESASALSQLSSRHLRIVKLGAPELKMFETLFESGRPRCGQIRDSQRDYLFGAGTVEIGSAALVPLGSKAAGKQPGAALLAIGSPDAERFHPTMSTEFLARIGDLVSEAIGVA